MNTLKHASNGSHSPEWRLHTHGFRRAQRVCEPNPHLCKPNFRACKSTLIPMRAESVRVQSPFGRMRAVAGVFHSIHVFLLSVSLQLVSEQFSQNRPATRSDDYATHETRNEFWS